MKKLGKFLLGICNLTFLHPEFIIPMIHLPAMDSELYPQLLTTLVHPLHLAAVINSESKVNQSTSLEHLATLYFADAAVRRVRHASRASSQLSASRQREQGHPQGDCHRIPSRIRLSRHLSQQRF